MANEWDNTIKQLIGENPQDYLSLVIEGAEFKESLSIELRHRLRKADLIFKAEVKGQPVLVHFEVQSSEDNNMPLRLLEYGVLAAREHQDKEHEQQKQSQRHQRRPGKGEHPPVVSCVIYLQKADDLPQSPLVWELPDGRKILNFEFVVIKLWEIEAENLINRGSPGLLPLLPLCKDGKQHAVVDVMLKELRKTRKGRDLLLISEMLAGLVFREEAEKEWLKGVFAMYKDIIEDSWVYQELMEEGIEKGKKIGIEEGIEKGEKIGMELGIEKGKKIGREEGIKLGIEKGEKIGMELGIQKAQQEHLYQQSQALLEAVRLHFPDVLEPARAAVARLTASTAVLQAIVQIGLARDGQQALQIINDLGDKASDQPV